MGLSTICRLTGRRASSWTFSRTSRRPSQNRCRAMFKLSLLTDVRACLVIRGFLLDSDAMRVFSQTFLTLFLDQGDLSAGLDLARGVLGVRPSANRFPGAKVEFSTRHIFWKKPAGFQTVSGPWKKRARDDGRRGSSDQNPPCAP